MQVEELELLTFHTFYHEVNILDDFFNTNKLIVFIFKLRTIPEENSLLFCDIYSA